jgi:protein-tyrosine phosphatase
MSFESTRNPSRLLLKAMYNVRDLGGFKTSDGHVTAYGRFLRADAPTRLDPDDLQKLLDFPVRTVIDLRSPSEFQGLENNLRDQPSINYVNIPLLGADLDAGIAAVQLSDPDRDKVGLPDLYIHLLEKSQEPMGQVFSLLANSTADGACLFHCSHGKDRTGLIAALLLMLAGVSDSDIIDNYQISYTYLKPWFDTFISTIPADILHFFNTNPQNMASTLSYFHRCFHSAEEYLATFCGVDQAAISELKCRMIS